MSFKDTGKMHTKTHGLLTVAGSDSGGGAGIQADLKTFQALGAYGMSVVSALTAQNTLGVGAIHLLPLQFVQAQFDHVAEDLQIDAVKTGMLFSSEIIEMVSDRLNYYQIANVVVDPVMVAKGGQKLLKNSAVETIKRCLLPLARVVTPNIPEAETLTGMLIRSREDMEKAATLLLNSTRNVVLKGGHLSSEGSPDLIATRDDGFHWLVFPRIATGNTHGTGCTYSAAIAAYLGRGESLVRAVAHAREYVQGALVASANRKLGKGCGPLDHGWNLERCL